jgi:hypothetical protein
MATIRDRMGQLPGRRALEVRSARVRMADALRDDQLPRLQQVAEAPERRVQADTVVDLDQLVPGQPKGLAMLGVALVGEGDDRVDAVVAAVQFQDDEDPIVAPWCRGTGGAGQSARKPMNSSRPRLR